MKQLKFRLASPEDASKVQAFNQRLAAAGESYHRLSLELPFRTMAHRPDSQITVEKIFCFDGDEIRGGVGVKRMQFRVNGSPEEIAFPVYPLSEGIVNPRYNMVGLMIYLEMLRRNPFIYSLGSPASANMQLVKKDGWFTLEVPFHLAVFRTYSFLRNINYLRKNKWSMLFCDLLAFSGIGTIGLLLFRSFQRLRCRQSRVKNLTIEQFDKWGEWTDEVWRAARDSYTLIGDRSKTALQSLYPDGHQHLIKLRFKHADTNRLIGWAVLTVSKMKNHKYFGDMTLSAIIDMLAVPADAYTVASGALAVARQKKADLLVVNHSDQRWNDAFKRAGMLSWKSNYTLALSPQLERRFNPIEDYTHRFYFTRGDGHGPTSFWMIDYHSDPNSVDFPQSLE